jgi:hypothetical protein
MKKVTYSAVIEDDRHQMVETFSPNLNEKYDLSEAVVTDCMFILEAFNSSLRSGELPRRLVYTRILKIENPVYQHDWEKASLVTERGGYDRYRCNHCKATGKRYGLSPYVRIDKQFKKIEFNCPHSF